MAEKQIRVFATCDIGHDAIQVLRDRGYEVEVYPDPIAPPKQLIVEKVKSGVDGLITTLRDRIDEEVFAAGAGRLKVVAQLAVGFDNIDRQAANTYQIPFTNTADVLTEATAEFAFLILAAAARKLYSAEKLVDAGQWKTWHPYLPFLGDEVTGRTIAIIGTGRIGQAMIKKCVGFDMNILCYDAVYQDEKFIERIRRVMDVRYEAGLCRSQQRIAYVGFEEAISQADFVSLHVPLIMPGEGPTPTYHLMDERALRLMKPTAYLVNTSRGPVVDEPALAAALLDDWIAGAALDVFEKEPLPLDSPLRDPRLEHKLRKYPHFASAGRATRLSTDPNVGMAGRCVQGLIDVIEGHYGGDPKKMPYVVNKEAFG
jgi:glyoxylate reductase